MPEIGASEVKNQFSRLLARTRNGEAFTDADRGLAVARRVPARDEPDHKDAREAIARLRAQAKRPRTATVSRAEILEWIAEGRR